MFRKQLLRRHFRVAEAGLLVPGLALGGLWVLLTGTAGPASSTPQQPVIDARKTEHVYNGPGRETNPTTPLKEVPVGYFGPDDPQDPESGDLWLAANLAVERLNASGGANGVPIRLIPAWSKNPWSAGIADIVKLVYSADLMALVSGVDGSAAHLAEQVVAKARLPLVNPAATDMTANLAHVPWIFTCLPGEDRQVGLLVGALQDAVRGGGFVLVSAVDHDSRVFVDEFLRAVSRAGHSPLRHIQIDSGTGDNLSGFSDPVVREAAAVVIIARPLQSARILKRLREVTEAPVFGTTAMGRRAFLEAAGNAAEGVVFPYPADLSSVRRFSEEFFARYHRPADFAAAQTYDSVLLLADAIRQAGFNRARIGDSLRELSGWTGVAGAIEWDATGQNMRPVGLVTVRSGQIEELLRP